MDDLGLVKTVDGLCEGVVVAVADAADRRLDAGLGEPLGVFDGDMLAAAVAVLNPALAADAVTPFVCRNFMNSLI